MKIRTLVRHMREGVKNLRRNTWMTFASVLSVTITLMILGVFLLLAQNINFIAGELENQVEITVFLELTAAEAEIKQVERKLQEIRELESIEFVAKEDGIERFIDSMGEQGRHFQDFKGENNPLPDIFIVRTSTPQDTPKVAEKITTFAHVYKVNYGASVVEKLFTVTNAVRNLGLIFVVGLAFTAMLLISNTIKITIVARRREIEIMRLVGAKNWFIRWPFIIEGLLLGVIGALIPIVVLIAGYHKLLEAVGEYLSLNFFELLPILPLAYQLSALLLGIGAFIGVWGSLMSVRRFLRI
ncbi:permease-like cell division protein FtsX [Caldalkalibacillus mannanilyticus]|uniref:permease-like cell division protein FtsX n=1 Tax=Caldalkalibacillus mannanilyticus TaxID=1418 RepID=UPI0004698133|nr:permease-like cell division protein FtsX [Caldalkalibacillus mannanilyticus]